MNRNKELEQSFADLQTLQQEGLLPSKMQLKLNYLQACISGQSIESNLLQGLPDFQKMSFQMMNLETKISLFNSIVRCLAGREVTVYFNAEKAYIKRQDSSSGSVNCYLFCNSNQLRVTRNKSGTDVMHCFQIQKLLVAKVFHSQKKKHYFGIAYESVKYRIKFQQQGPCARVHGAMLSAVRQKKSLKEKITQREEMSEKKNGLNASQWEQTGQQRLLDEQQQYLHHLLKKVQEAQMQSDDGFQLIKNLENGKIMVNRQSNKVKVLLFIEKCSIQGLIESYVQLNAWNVHVDSFKIIKHLRQNTFIAQLRLKKRNFFTSAREAVLTINYFKDCKCLYSNQACSKNKDKHYLIFSTGELQDQNIDRTAVPITFSQIIEFSQIKERPGAVFVNLLSQIDYNVYQYFQRSVDLHLEFMQDLSSIAVVSRQREILAKGKYQLFEFGVCVCDRRKKKCNFLQPQLDRSARRPSQVSDIGYINQFNEEEAFGVDLTVAQIKKVIEQNIAFKVNDKILTLVQKKLYEKYYLKQKFKVTPSQQPYKTSDYHLKQRKNYLGLGQTWKLTKSNQFVFIDEEQLKLHKGILKTIVKQITSNIMAGKSIMNMTMPVEIFDDMTALEGLAWLFGFVPVFMDKALKQKQLFQQIKYIALSLSFIFSCFPKIGKPFNPILGQTVQASIGGIPLFMQQTSHHPPISSFLLKTDKFQISGSFQITVDVGLNSAHMKLPIPFKVKIYQNKADYIIKLPQVYVGGVMFGDRTLKNIGKSYVVQKNSGTYLEISAGKEKKRLYEYKTKIRDDDLVGGVFKITKQAVDRLLAIDNKKTVQGIKQEEVIEKHATITGKWFGEMNFDGVCYKSVQNGPFPVELQRPTVLLPSDSAFRLDVVYRRWRNFRKSNQEKEILENIQRRDRKLRQQYHSSK